MWIRTGELDLFATTVDEGDYTWNFDGDTYTILGKKNNPVFTNPRYSVTIRELNKLMPKLYTARIAFLERMMPMNSALKKVENVD